MDGWMDGWMVGGFVGVGWGWLLKVELRLTKPASRAGARALQ